MKKYGKQGLCETNIVRIRIFNHHKKGYHFQPIFELFPGWAGIRDLNVSNDNESHPMAYGTFTEYWNSSF